MGAVGMGAAYGTRGLPGLPQMGVSLKNSNRLSGELVPGEPMEIPVDEWEAIKNKPAEPFQVTIPYIKDFNNNGYLIARFFTTTPDGVKYWKLAGRSPLDIDESLKKFIIYFRRKYSVQGEFSRILSSTVDSIKQELEEVEEFIDKLNSKLYAATDNFRDRDIQVIELLEDRKKQLLEQIDAALRVEALGFKTTK